MTAYARPAAGAPVIHEFRDWRNAQALFRAGVYKSPMGLLALAVQGGGILPHADFSGLVFEDGRADGLQAPGARFARAGLARVSLAGVSSISA